MGKHVCPICEDVYAYRGELSLSNGTTTDAYEAWYCPQCDYSFIGTADVRQAIKEIIAGTGSQQTEVSFARLAEGPVVRRV